MVDESVRAGFSYTGMSISVKLVLSTCVVVAAAVSIVSWLSVDAINAVVNRSTAVQMETVKTSMFRESELIAKSVANAVALPMATNQFSEIRPVFTSYLEKYGSGISKSPTVFAAQLRWLRAWDINADITDESRTTTDERDDALLRTDDAPHRDDEIAKIELGFSATAKPSDLQQFEARRDVWIFKTPITFGSTAMGSLWIEISMESLSAARAEASRAAAQLVWSYRVTVWSVAGGILLCVLLVMALYGLSLARPIGVLTEQAARIAGGDLGSRVPVQRNDELGVLGLTFNFMADRIGLLLVEQAEKATLDHEMSLARSVQQAMLPPHSMETYGHLRVVGYCAPASSCGGDWWMMRKLSGDRMLIVVGDATGHGIHSAMIAATARGAVEALAAIDERLLTPDQVLRAIDSAIRNVGDHHVLMTAFAAVLDSTTASLHYANAGQNFPYIVRSGNSRKLEDAVILATGGNPLGDREIPMEIRGGTRELRPGDVFVCFTDGLVERANPGGAMFGDRRLLRILRGHSVDGDQALVSLRERVVAAIEEFAEGELASDDITFVMCQYDPLPAAHSAQLVGAG